MSVKRNVTVALKAADGAIDAYSSWLDARA